MRRVCAQVAGLSSQEGQPVETTHFLTSPVVFLVGLRPGISSMDVRESLVTIVVRGASGPQEKARSSQALITEYIIFIGLIIMSLLG